MLCAYASIVDRHKKIWCISSDKKLKILSSFNLFSAFRTNCPFLISCLLSKLPSRSLLSSSSSSRLSSSGGPTQEGWWGGEKKEEEEEKEKRDNKKEEEEEEPVLASQDGTRPADTGGRLQEEGEEGAFL